MIHYIIHCHILATNTLPEEIAIVMQLAIKLVNSVKKNH